MASPLHGSLTMGMRAARIATRRKSVPPMCNEPAPQPVSASDKRSWRHRTYCCGRTRARARTTTSGPTRTCRPPPRGDRPRCGLAAPPTSGTSAAQPVAPVAPTSAPAEPVDPHLTASGAIRDLFTGSEETSAWFHRLDEAIIKPTLLLDQNSRGGGGGSGGGGGGGRASRPGR